MLDVSLAPAAPATSRLFVSLVPVPEAWGGDEPVDLDQRAVSWQATVRTTARVASDRYVVMTFHLGRGGRDALRRARFCLLLLLSCRSTEQYGYPLFRSVDVLGGSGGGDSMDGTNTTVRADGYCSGEATVRKSY